MADKTWKAVERRIAARLGAERVGCTGKATADVVTDWLSVEVKARKALPGWLLNAMSQAEQASEDGRLPIVVLHQKHKHHDDDLVMLRLSDFEAWFGGNDETQDYQAD